MPPKMEYFDVDLEDEEFWLLQAQYEPLDSTSRHAGHDPDSYASNHEALHSSAERSRKAPTDKFTRRQWLRPFIVRLRSFLLPPGIASTFLQSNLRPHRYHYHQLPRVILGRRSRIRQYCLLLFACVGLGPIFFLLLVLAYGGFPPSYASVRTLERALPQHHWKVIQLENVQAMERVDSEERYLRFPDHLWGHGLNNVLQEAMLYALIAHKSNRSFVFEDYVWSHLPLPYTIYDFTLRPTRVPMSAFLGGWLVGEGEEGGSSHSSDETNAAESRTIPVLRKFARRGKQSTKPSSPLSTSSESTNSSPAHHRRSLTLPTSFGDDSSQELSAFRRSISSEYFEHVCPPWKTVEIAYPDETGLEHISHINSRPPKVDADGLEILRWWVDRLSQEDLKNEQCIVVSEKKRRVWDPNFFGTPRILSLYQPLNESPVLRNFRWSPLVKEAVERNIGTFFRSASPVHPVSSHIDPAAGVSSASNFPSTSIIPGMLAVHLRRGDYSRHCVRLSQWGAGYMGWNRFVGGDGFEAGLREFLERDDEPSTDAFDTKPKATNREARKEFYYLAHCLPTIPQTVRRLNEIRRSYEASLNFSTPSRANSETGSLPRHQLSQVYILTNGWPSFVEDLRTALVADGWDRVVGSTDLEHGLFADPRDAASNNQSGARRSKMAGSAGLNAEERGVSAAVDMALAERAEVFVGNGFSSLSANIVLLRMAKSFADYSNWML